MNRTCVVKDQEQALIPEEEPLPASQVLELLRELPNSVCQGLYGMLDAVLTAKAPASFSRALGELEAYLSALQATNALSFEQELKLKAYVMQGWKSWRSSVQSIPYPVGCPYCGSPTPVGDDLQLDQWAHFHCPGEECGARLKLGEDGQAVGYINQELERTATQLDGDQLIGLLGELYQVLGALDAPEAVLDQVAAALEGAPLPLPSLLPFHN